MTNKPSLSIKEQIALLKSRGMTISNEDNAAFHLHHINYYRLKGYWWDMQQNEKEHTFKEEACFEDVIDRYYFDKDLRLILFDAIESIEIALRTKLVYYLSQSYGSLYYTDESLFFNRDSYQKHFKNLREELMRSREAFAEDYKKKYGEWDQDDKKCIDLTDQPDAWIIFEVATFSMLSGIYKNLENKVPEKKNIANDFGLNAYELSSWLHAISYLRNIVAHHSRIWSRNMEISSTMEINNPKGLWLTRSFLEMLPNNSFLVITAMLYLCNAINAQNTYKKKMLTLIKNNPNIPIEKIGFLKHWDNQPIWKDT